MSMIVSDKVYIDMTTHQIDERITDVLTYRNPEYYQKMNMGLSVYHVPKTVVTSWIDGSNMVVMRGEISKLKPFVAPWDPIMDHLDHPVKLQYINTDFELDDFQNTAIETVKSRKQGVIHAVTSAGKSLIILKSIVELKQKALIVVHRKILMQQFLKDIDKYIRDENGNKITPGIIGNGKYSIGPITVAIDKSLSSHLTDCQEAFGTLFLDECHLAPANTIFSLINGINSKYRFGVSGTLRRKDQKEFLIFSTFGPVIYTIGKDELLEKGRVVPVQIKIEESDTRFDSDGAIEELGTTKARALQERTIAFSPGRHDQILSLVARLSGKTLVLNRMVEPCYVLQNELERRFNIKAGVITGKDGKEALESYEAMKEGDLQVIFATVGCVSTGISISDLDNIILAAPIYTNELLLHQIRGRLMRTSEGKTHGTLYFIWDSNIYPEFKLNKFKRLMEI